MMRLIILAYTTPLLLTPSSGFQVTSPLNRQIATRIGTKLLEQKKDDDDKEKRKKEYNNNLDIFGQPKDKPKVFEDEGDIRGSDRIKSCIPYILPLIDGDAFGKYIYERIPPLGSLDYVLLRPLVEGVNAAPFLGIFLFLIFALGPQLTGQSREVRFNAQQAVLIDVALIIPELISDGISDANLPRTLMEPCSNFVYYFYVSCVLYSVVSNLRGEKPDKIPFISSASEYVIGPF